jgi:hypothetical protein
MAGRHVTALVVMAMLALSRLGEVAAGTGGL